MKKRRLLIFSCLVVALLVGGCGLWVWQAKRQYALNQQLIAALVKYDTKQALTLINAGADPNTLMEPAPAPTLHQLLRQLLHRLPPPDESSHTALTFTCAMSSVMDNDEKRRHPSSVDLVQAMLAHSANMNMPIMARGIALEVAAYQNQPRIVELLLAHGANINTQNDEGSTPLIEAANHNCPEMVDCLLAHGAAVNIQDKDGNTALHRAVWGYPDAKIVRHLLLHGADPNYPNKQGQTPLTLVQHPADPDYKDAEVIALLRQGAK